MTTYKPDFEKAEKKAYEVILDSGLRKTPVNLKKIINSIDNLTLLSYKKFGKLRGLSKNEVKQWTQSEEGCLWYCKEDDQYILLYNNAVTHIGRKRFTLAHELGHYFLKHNERSERSLLSRNALSPSEIDAFEKEANLFARKLLAPLPIVDLLLDNLTKISQDVIMQVFDVSFTVSGIVIKDLKRRAEHGISRTPHRIANHFKKDIYSLTHYFQCSRCGNSDFKRSECCRICGGTEYVENSISLETLGSKYKSDLINWEGGFKRMIYKKIETDANGRVYKCPTCENEKLDATQNNCQVCNTYLYNQCSGLSDTDFAAAKYSALDAVAENLGCGKKLSGDARFCSCGKMSTFFLDNVLPSWEQEKTNSNSN
ncbi:ImmA/IrrE family metallo-endopeptidase [Listeria sp. ILCC792]|uniref:ImmA/IrrE family metallo-endopeptidase n=1 Tax=Listeria sp. ILCC792 TaxID=1918331 RepID=UPI0013564C3A|nr:ImmA/IrrE family metallo-endopeptidase [Listeria sp. ILCC792]